ncbi:MAG: PilZ domain-containing protein [Nitrospirota bacterium]
MLKTKLKDSRRHVRKIGSGTVEYSVISSGNNRVSYGIISDVSSSGMCLLTSIPLQHGERVLVKKGLQPSRTAEVLWSDAGAFYYKAGIRFLKKGG